MRTAYAIVGCALILVVGAALFLINRAHAPRLPSGASLLLSNQLHTMLTLSSPAFAPTESIPSRFSCDGDDINPELSIAGVPEGTQSLVLLMDDPDIPDFVKVRMGIDTFDHWVLFNMSPETRTISENAVPEGAVVGQNSSGENVYRGPCPPDREHRYFFKLYALDTMLELEKDVTKAQVEAAMVGHILESTELVGRYKRLEE